jgi:hypothetical protein
MIHEGVTNPQVVVIACGSIQKKLLLMVLAAAVIRYAYVELHVPRENSKMKAGKHRANRAQSANIKKKLANKTVHSVAKDSTKMK